jgi:hypothetical protein
MWAFIYSDSYTLHTPLLSGKITSVLVVIPVAGALILQGLCIRQHYLIWKAYGYLKSAQPTLIMLIRACLLSLITLVAVM